MIIKQVPACNPAAKNSKSIDLAHKTRFVLAYLIWEEDERDLALPQHQRTSSLVESTLSLVSYEVLRIMDPLDEAILREKLIWECDAGVHKELTSAGVVASKLMGTPIGGADDYVVHRGNVSFVTYESSDAVPGGSPRTAGGGQKDDSQRKIEGSRGRSSCRWRWHGCR